MAGNTFGFETGTACLMDSNKNKSIRRTQMPEEKEDNTIYKVVVNHEEQYSIWPANRENALGWKDAGKSGTKQECLAYIIEVWTDMRPLSLRKKMQEQGIA
jgi:MbtH protein